MVSGGLILMRLVVMSVKMKMLMMTNVRALHCTSYPIHSWFML